jgi:anti-anti-sigma factor
MSLYFVALPIGAGATSPRLTGPSRGGKIGALLFMTTDSNQMTVAGRAGSRAGQHILKVSGPIKYGALEPLQEAIQAAPAQGLILDLTDVPYVDSSAVGVLVQVYVSCRKAQRKLALVGMSGRVRNVLHLASVDLLFTTFDSLPEAEEALQN